MPRLSKPAAAWPDWVAAAPLALLAFNVHVSTQGDALSAMTRSDRRLVYGAVLITEVVVLLGALYLRPARSRTPVVTAVVGAATALAALLLDVQDGPVRTVQLFFLLGMFAVVVALARVVAGRASTLA